MRRELPQKISLRHALPRFITRYARFMLTRLFRRYAVTYCRYAIATLTPCRFITFVHTPLLMLDAIFAMK